MTRVLLIATALSVSAGVATQCKPEQIAAASASRFAATFQFIDQTIGNGSGKRG